MQQRFQLRCCVLFCITPHYSYVGIKFSQRRQRIFWTMARCSKRPGPYGHAIGLGNDQMLRKNWHRRDSHWPSSHLGDRTQKTTKSRIRHDIPHAIRYKITRKKARTTRGHRMRASTELGSEYRTFFLYRRKKHTPNWIRSMSAKVRTRSMPTTVKKNDANVIPAPMARTAGSSRRVMNRIFWMES